MAKFLNKRAGKSSNGTIHFIFSLVLILSQRSLCLFFNVSIKHLAMLENILIQTRKNIQLGKADVYENLCIFPLLSGADTGPGYLSMKTALEKQQMEIQEISESGSVPNLKVINHSDLPVLIIDGEELAGAKQNRIANTSILVPARKEIQIPVSCTEQGRWRYNSSTFSDSGVVMASRARSSSSARVTTSLRQERGFVAGQGEVWRDVAHLHERSGTRSNTLAMKDAFELKQQQIEAYLQAFPLREGQKGIIVFMNGQLAGMDYLSRHAAYADIHEKLLKSHVIEAIADPKTGRPASELPEEAAEFLDRQLMAPATERPSVGLGKDYRLEGSGDASAILAYNEQIIHWTAYSNSMVDNPGRIIR